MKVFGRYIGTSHWIVIIVVLWCDVKCTDDLWTFFWFGISWYIPSQVSYHCPPLTCALARPRVNSKCMFNAPLPAVYQWPPAASLPPATWVWGVPTPVALSGRVCQAHTQKQGEELCIAVRSPHLGEWNTCEVPTWYAWSVCHPHYATKIVTHSIYCANGADTCWNIVSSLVGCILSEFLCVDHGCSYCLLLPLFLAMWLSDSQSSSWAVFDGDPHHSESFWEVSRWCLFDEEV